MKSKLENNIINSSYLVEVDKKIFMKAPFEDFDILYYNKYSLSHFLSIYDRSSTTFKCAITDKQRHEWLDKNYTLYLYYNEHKVLGYFEGIIYDFYENALIVLSPEDLRVLRNDG